MKIFVTGATGFVGRRVVARFLELGHEVTALLLAHEKVPFGSFTALKIVRGDITTQSSLDGLTKGHDAVIHLAAAVGYGQTWELCQKVNALGAKMVAREAVSSGIRRFIQMSSVSVYGRQSGCVITEQTPLRRTGDPYGDTKIEAEEYLWSLSAQGLIDLTVVRPTVIYGPGDDKFLPKLLENIRLNRARVIGDGRNRVDLVHVDDVARFLEKILFEPKAFAQAFNLANEKNPSWGEFLPFVAKISGSGRLKQPAPYWVAFSMAAVIEAISKLSKKEPRVTRYAVRVIGRSYFYSARRSAQELNFETKVDLFEGIKFCIEGLGKVREC